MDELDALRGALSSQRRSTSSRRSAPCHSCDDRSPQITVCAPPGSRCGRDFGSCGPRSLPRSPRCSPSGISPAHFGEGDASWARRTRAAWCRCPRLVRVYTLEARELRAARTCSGLSWRYVVDVTRESWLAPDGSGRIVTTVEDARFLTSADEQAWVDAGSPSLTRPDEERFRAGTFPSRDVGSLPTTPAALRRELVAQVEAQAPGASTVFDEIGLCCRSPGIASIACRPLRVAAGLPDIADLGGSPTPWSGRIAVVEEDETPTTPCWIPRRRTCWPSR